MYEIVSDVDRPARDTVEGFRAVPAPVASDVMGKNTRTMDSGIKPVEGSMAATGTAVTVDAQSGDNLVLHKALSMAEPGDVLVVDANAYPEAGIWGELMSVTATEFDLAGTVVDGAVRDVRDVGDLGYPVFSRHVSPKGSTKHHAGSVNVPVSCGGIVVEPGDVVVGDADGVAVVPADRADEVLKECEAKLDREQSARETANTPANYEEEFAEFLDPHER